MMMLGLKPRKHVSKYSQAIFTYTGTKLGSTVRGKEETWLLWILKLRGKPLLVVLPL